MSADDEMTELAWWNSLTDEEREAHAVLTDEQKAELDRRWARYKANPASAISMDEMKRRLGYREAR